VNGTKNGLVIQRGRKGKEGKGRGGKEGQISSVHPQALPSCSNSYFKAFSKGLGLLEKQDQGDDDDPNKS